jgi:hypothetical protein
MDLLVFHRPFSKPNPSSCPQPLVHFFIHKFVNRRFRLFANGYLQVNGVPGTLKQGQTAYLHPGGLQLSVSGGSLLANLTGIYGNSVTLAGGAYSVGIQAGPSSAYVTINGNQVLGARQGAVANPFGGSVIDSKCRAALISLLDKLRSTGHGLIG